MLESWRLVVRCCARLLLVGGAVTYSAWAPALGLGDITLHSALNQPLHADIALVDAAGLEEGELSVSLATADEFGRAGVERAFFLNDLKFTPILRGNRSLIRVSSSKPVNEPFLNFLVQLNQPNGRLLREYTVLIDPPGSPGIVPVSDEPVAKPRSSAFPTVQPATAPKVSAAKPRVDQPAATPVNDLAAEQLAASVLQNQQLQATLDELKSKLQTQDEQIAGQKQQVAELQAQLAEVKQTSVEPVVPTAVVPAPVVVEEPEVTHWLLILGLLAVVALVPLGLFVRRQRQQVQALPEPLPVLPSRHEPVLNRTAEPAVQAATVKPAPVPGDEPPEGGDAGFDVQQLQDIRARHPKLSSVAPVVAAPVITPPPAALSSDEFQLNLDDLSMDSNWDLISPFENTASPAKSPSEPAPVEPPFTSNLHVLPDVFEMPDEPELEWVAEPDAQSLDDTFLDEFNDPGQPLELEPLDLEPSGPSNAGKLEQARTCINDGDLDSAIELLNELLKDSDESLKQTARSLLAGIR
ncbi:FimV/HubP family polar landmark protein [Pseudomonas sp. XS1P51]